jgi:murein DD-endopeptidase MepM/ murein hydrolase activator NlpD
MMGKSRLMLTGLAASLALGAHSARADEARIRVMSEQLPSAPLAASAGLSDPEFAEPARITFGRAADIEGTPIDYSRYRPPPKPGVAGAAGKAGAAGSGGGRALVPAGAFVWPSRLPLAAAALSSRFGARYHPILGGWRQHSGVDLAAATGTPVTAPSPGVVVAAQWWGGYGLLVAIDHGKGMQTRYAHLSQIAVAYGQQVSSGQVLGYVGSTGNSTGPHLHYEMRLNGQPLNPLTATGAR